jgi:thiol-disulfide isomerase/thioredoxin
VTRRLASVVVAALVLVACGSGDPDATQQGAGSAERLPDVDIEPLAGGDAVSLADIEGPAVVNLWATWCAPCRAEIPDFEEVHRARDGEVRFVGINVGEDADRAAAFVAEVGATYDQFRDPQGYVVTELRTSAMPVTIVIDSAGDVVTRNLGPMDVDDLDAAIDQALSSG